MNLAGLACLAQLHIEVGTPYLLHDCNTLEFQTKFTYLHKKTEEKVI